MRSGTRWMLVAAVAAAGLAGAAGGARGDIIQLNDGQTINGTMRRDGERVIITAKDGKTTTVAANAIAKVTLQSDTSPAELASAEWTRISALAPRQNTLAAVIDLYQKYLDKYPHETDAAEAKKALDHYQSLVGQDVLKYRGKWMTRDMIKDQERAWESEAEGALAAYKAGKLADARQAATEAIAGDPENPTTLALAGLASYRLNDLPKAKQFFTKLAAVDPGSVLAENNLGVIAFSQKSQPEALIHYTKAIQAKPDNRLVLDNAADAMGAFIGSKDLDAYRNLARQYSQAEAAMETEMAKRGLYRFGDTWVTREQKEKAGADKEQIAAAKAQLDTKYAQAKRKVDLLTQQLQAAQNDYNNTQASLSNLSISQVGTTPGNYNGVNVDYNRALLAQNLDQIAQRKAALQTQLDQANLELQPMFAEAKRLLATEAAIPNAPYSGVQQIMELADVDDPPAPAPLDMKAAPAAAAPAPAAPTVPTAPATPVGGTPYMPTSNGGGGGGYDGGGIGIGLGGGFDPGLDPPVMAPITPTPTTQPVTTPPTTTPPVIRPVPVPRGNGNGTGNGSTPPPTIVRPM